MSSLQALPLSRPSPWVREIETPDGAALLDIRRGLCLSLTPVAAKIWRYLRASDSIDRIIDMLLSEYDVARDQICKDTEQFISNLCDQELLLGSTASDFETTPSSLLRFLVKRYRQFLKVGSLTQLSCSALRTCQVLGLLTLYDLTPLHKQFAVLHAVVREWPVGASRAQSLDPNEICKSLNLACIWYPKQVLCLQRSFVLTCILRSYGLPAIMVIGAQKLPFQAHAWTEINGRPINESSGIESRYFAWDRW
jgi:hypothetical protein